MKPRWTSRISSLAILKLRTLRISRMQRSQKLSKKSRILKMSFNRTTKDSRSLTKAVNQLLKLSAYRTSSEL